MSTAPPKIPKAASARRYLRGNLPAVYSEGVDGAPLTVMGLLEGLEQVLDPVVALLDNLGPHLQPATAPSAMIDFLARLTGAPVDPTLPDEARRRLLRSGARIAAARGTKAGLQLALKCAFPHLEPVVEDHGGVTCQPAGEPMSARSGTGTQTRPGPGMPARSEPEPASFEVCVRVSKPLSPNERAQLDRCIADHLPVGAAYDLRQVERGHGGKRRG